MAERKAISKRMRFEVLKRDSFTCQYCGKQPPDAVLHLDHIKPVSKGGKNTVLNLVTSCVDCNLGKSNVELSDDSAIKKQQSQLNLMAEKKTQIELMIKWRDSLESADELLVDSIVNLINKLMAEYHLNEDGIMKVRKAVSKRGYQAVYDSVKLFYNGCSSVKVFSDNWSKGLSLKDNGGLSINYAKGILRNRFTNFNEKKFYSFFNNFKLSEEQVEQVIEESKCCISVYEFYNACEVNL